MRTPYDPDEAGQVREVGFGTISMGPPRRLVALDRLWWNLGDA